MRGLGVVLACLGGVFAVGGLASFALSSGSTRVGSAIVGGLAIGFGGGGALILALPETTHEVDFGAR